MKRILSIVLTGLLVINSIGLSFASSTIEDVMKSGIDEANETLENISSSAKDSLISVGSSINASVEAYLSNLTDIDGHWAESNIQELIDQGVFKGYPDGTFKPDNEISVVELIKILVASSYTDREYIQGSPWYQVYVDEAVKRNIISINEFESYTRPITRYEIALLIARAGENKGKIKTKSVSKTNFVDDSKFTSNERNIISAVSTAGIITGYPNGDFGPNKKATRAEASVMLNRFLKLEGNGLPSEPTSIVDQMIANVLDSKSVIPLTYSQVEQLANNTVPYKVPGTEDIRDIPNIIYPQSCIVGNGIIEIADTTNMGTSLSDIVDILAVLAVHAEKNNQMVAVGGGGNGVYIWYGENFETLRNDEYLFSIGFKRQVDWAQEKEFDGKIYIVDREVTIDFLMDGIRLEKEENDMHKRDEYRETHVDMEEDVLNALYDGLRVLDKKNAEDLFSKITEDYKYAKTHIYKNGENNEFFELKGTRIYKEDHRSSYGGGSYGDITYSFIK